MSYQRLRNFRINLFLDPAQPLPAETFVFIADSPLQALSQLHTFIDQKREAYRGLLATNPTSILAGRHLTIIEQEPITSKIPSST